jgi:beta-glucanase (GH16 family)
MNKLYLSLLFIVAAVFISAAQQMPLEFEDDQENFIPFSGAGFSFNFDPTDTANRVGQFNNNGADANQGFFLDLNRPIDLDANQVIDLRFYAFDPNQHTVKIKLEQGLNDDVELTQTVGGSATTWNTVSFDFSNANFSGTGAAVNGSGTYSRITVFVDFGANTPGTYLIDDIDDGSTPTDPNQLDVVYTDLVWADEFDTPGTQNPIDANNWFHQTQIPAGGSWFNGEVQHYTDRIENSYVENGMLNIMAKRETFTDQGVTKEFTSARLNSKFAFTYGRIDVRAKLPLGDGTWPAIWTLGKNINEAGGFWQPQFGTVNWPACGEIDVMEHGLGAVNHVSAALHTPSSFGNTQNFRARTLTDVANTFYVYSMNWSPNQITFLIDDVPFYTYSPAVRDANTYPFNEDQYILLNVAMGGIAGAIDPSFQQSPMVIDYVRVYQNTASIDGASFEEGIKIYPNPSHDFFQIESKLPLDSIEIYDLRGVRISSQKEQTDRVDVTGLSSGIYLMKLTSGNQEVVKRVVVE